MTLHVGKMKRIFCRYIVRWRPWAMDSPRRWRPSVEMNVLNQPGNDRPVGRVVRNQVASRFPPLGGKNSGSGRGSAIRSGGQSDPRSTKGTAANMRATKSDAQMAQSSGISDISDALRQQYAAIIQIAEAVNAKPPALLPTRGDMDVVRAENTELQNVVERQSAEISQLRAALTQLQAQLQGVAAAVAAPPPAVAAPPPAVAAPPPAINAVHSAANSPARRTPRERTLSKELPAIVAQHSQPPPHRGTGLESETWVAVLGPCVRQKHEFCVRLAKRLGGQIVRAGPQKPTEGMAESQQQLHRLLDAMCKGHGPHVLSDFPRTAAQLRDVSIA